MSSIPQNEKYIIFLNPRYFKKTIFKSIYKKLIKNLEITGISVFNIKHTSDQLKQLYKKTSKNRKLSLSFDGLPFPTTNTLYINLFNGQYYNDTIYSKKKIEIEREMLFLLAGKLGVHNIYYNTTINETTISKINAGININSLNNSIDFNKTIQINKTINGKEEYLNRGAPVYLKSTNLQEVEDNIKNRIGIMESNVFNYNFYKNSTKLESFVYKRFEFKMLKLEYTIDTEDILDISFSVKSIFMKYGLNISFDKNTSCSETTTYTLEFFTDKELKIEFFNTKREFTDEFYNIKEQYDCTADVDLGVHYISEYVIKLASKCYYKVDDIIFDFSKRLADYIKNNDTKYYGDCHQFKSTSQIKNWIYKTLTEPNFEIVNNNDININNNISKVQSNELEIEELEKLKSKENERMMSKIIPNNNYTDKEIIIKSPIHMNEEDYSNRLCTMTEDNNNPFLLEESKHLAELNEQLIQLDQILKEEIECKAILEESIHEIENNLITDSTIIDGKIKEQHDIINELTNLIGEKDDMIKHIKQDNYVKEHYLNELKNKLAELDTENSNDEINNINNIKQDIEINDQQITTLSININDIKYELEAAISNKVHLEDHISNIKNTIVNTLNKYTEKINKKNEIINHLQNEIHRIKQLIESDI